MESVKKEKKQKIYFKEVTQNIKNSNNKITPAMVLILIVFAAVCILIYFKSSANKIDNNLNYDVDKLEIEEVYTINKTFFYTKNVDNVLNLYNSQNEYVTKNKFINVESPLDIDNETYFLVQKEAGKYGLIDVKGKYIIPSEYRQINCFDSTRVCSAVNDDKIDLYDMSGKLIISNKNEKYYYEYYDSYSFPISYEFNKAEYSPIIKNNRLGIIDIQGNTVIDTIYSINIKKNKGNTIVYDDIYSVVNDTKKGIYFILKNDTEKYGVLDVNGNKVIDFLYDELVYDSKIDMFLAIKNKVNLALDYTGTILNTFTVSFDLTREEEEHLVNSDNYTIYTGKTGEQIMFNKEFNLTSGTIEKANDYTYISSDETGKILRDYKGNIILNGYKYMTYTSDNDNEKRVITCNTDDKNNLTECSLFSELGVKLSESYDTMYAIKNSDLIQIQADNKCGLIDKNGTIKIELNDKYSNGNGCTYNLLDKSDKYIITSYKKMDEENSNGIVNAKNEAIIEPTEGASYKYLNDNLIVMNSETTSKIYNAKGTYLSTELTEDDLLENCIGKYKGNFYFKGKTGDKNYIYILSKK